MDLTTVDPSDERGFRDWHTALSEGSAEGREAPVLESLAALRASLSDPSTERRRIAVAAVDTGRTLGAMLIEESLLEDLDVLYVETAVPPQYRRQRVGTGLWQWASRRAAQQHRTVVQAEVHVPSGRGVDSWPGAGFAAALGFESVHVEDHLVLDLPYELTRLPEPEPPGGGGDSDYSTSSWTGPCPPQNRTALAGLHTAMSRDVPIGGLVRDVQAWDEARLSANEARAAVSYTTLTTLARTAAGTAVGYSLIYVPHDDAANPLQEDTLVLGGHRGHGLGAAMKAANLRALSRLLGGGAGHLHTWTAPDNVAMQHLNRRFGFRPVEQLHEMQLRLGRAP